MTNRSSHFQTCRLNLSWFGPWIAQARIEIIMSLGQVRKFFTSRLALNSWVGSFLVYIINFFKYNKGARCAGLPKEGAKSCLWTRAKLGYGCIWNFVENNIRYVPIFIALIFGPTNMYILTYMWIDASKILKTILFQAENMLKGLFILFKVF